MPVKISQKTIGQPRHPLTHLKYVAGEYHYYLGKKYRLSIKKGTEDQVTLKKKTLSITCKNRPTQKKVKHLLETWYLEKAKTLFSKMMRDCWKKFNYTRKEMPRMRIRHMKTYWGTISLLTYTVTLNSDLMKTPRVCIRYIIIHEFCHLASMYHDKPFYELLAKMDSNWEKHRALLQHFPI